MTNNFQTLQCVDVTNSLWNHNERKIQLKNPIVGRIAAMITINGSDNLKEFDIISV